MNTIQEAEFEVLKEFDRICKAHNIIYSLGYGTLIGAIRHGGFIPWDDDIDIIMLRDEYEKFKRIVEDEVSDDYIYVDNDTEPKFYYGFAKLRSRHKMMPEASTEYLGIEQGVWIDIFPFDAIPDDPQLAVAQKKEIKKIHQKFVAFVFTHPMKSDNSVKKTIKTFLHILNKLTKNWVKPRLKWYKEMERLSKKYNHTNTKFYNCLGMNFTEEEYQGSMLTYEELNTVIDWTFESQKFPIVANYDSLLRGIYGDYMKLPPEQERVSNHDVKIIE